MKNILLKRICALLTALVLSVSLCVVAFSAVLLNITYCGVVADGGFVPADTAILIKFSGNVADGSVKRSNQPKFRVYDSSENLVPVYVNVGEDDEGNAMSNTVSIIPAKNFTEGEKYIVYIEKGVKAADGAVLAETETFSFVVSGEKKTLRVKTKTTKPSTTAPTTTRPTTAPTAVPEPLTTIPTTAKKTEKPKNDKQEASTTQPTTTETTTQVPSVIENVSGTTIRITVVANSGDDEDESTENEETSFRDVFGIKTETRDGSNNGKQESKSFDKLPIIIAAAVVVVLAAAATAILRKKFF